MQLSDIGRGVFGYKKNDVYRYIAEISGEFSARLDAAEEASEKRIAALESENNALKERIAELTKENEAYKAATVPSIPEAGAVAESRKEEADRAAVTASVAVCGDGSTKPSEGERSDPSAPRPCFATAEKESAKAVGNIGKASAGDDHLSLFRSEGSRIS